MRGTLVATETFRRGANEIVGDAGRTIYTNLIKIRGAMIARQHQGPFNIDRAIAALIRPDVLRPRTNGGNFAHAGLDFTYGIQRRSRCFHVVDIARSKGVHLFRRLIAEMVLAVSPSRRLLPAATGFQRLEFTPD